MIAVLNSYEIMQLWRRRIVAESHRGGCDRDRFSGRLDACQKNGRPGGPLSRHGEKIHVPGVDFPEKGKIMVHIEQGRAPETAYPQYSCFRGFVFFEGENRAVKCGAAAYIVSM